MTGLVSIFISAAIFAEPISDIRLVAKVLSYDTKTIMIEMSTGRKFKVPRKAIKADIVSGKKYEIALTKEVFEEMKSKSTDPAKF